MKIILIFTGKTTEKYLIEPINTYLARIKNYIPIELVVTRDFHLQSFSEKELLKKTEADEILKRIESNDFIVLLDENGKELTSTEFAQFITSQTNRNTRRLVFIVGGAYGFSPIMYQRANMVLSLSRMTFTHQMVRLILVEQLYRACTILRGEPYHHE
ncbi:MAG: 23S rRNA (pseudouridine(1915)-N(3))-methyltransferase RlmH [Bacteroidales bacterium]|nr:23S rRNA (pseudouridine(1915)-N(3))-methyltransferase RlmH [Bacteroidales bacterium]